MNPFRILFLGTTLCALTLMGCEKKETAPDPVESASVSDTPAPKSEGIIRGKVHFKGVAPVATELSTAADPACSSLRSSSLISEEAVINSNQTVRNVFVYISAGLEEKTFPVPTAKIVLDQKGCQYVPHVLGIQTGQTLEILNSDSTLHNLHGMPVQSSEFNFGMPIQGMKLKKIFDKPEVMVSIKCDVHPWMKAYIGVVAHPFFAVTGDDGSFELKGLPAGPYFVKAWHEKFGIQEKQILIDGSTPVELDFSFQSL